MMSDAVRSIDASPNCPAGIGVGVPNGLVSGAGVDRRFEDDVRRRSGPHRARPLTDLDLRRPLPLEDVVDEQVALMSIGLIAPERGRRAVHRR